MPDQPSWLDRVSAILDTLDSPDVRSLPFLTRASIESLFDLKRRQAIYLMKTIGRYQIGKAFVVDREVLRRWLEAAKLGEKVWVREMIRTRIEDLVEEAQWDREARKTRAVVPRETVYLKIDGIPPTVSLQPGELKIEFFGAEDLFRQLFELAQVMRNDYDKFKALVDEDLPSGLSTAKQPGEKK